MSEILEFSGKDLKEALEAASAELDMQPDFIDYEIIKTEGGGFFGLLRKKEVTIRIKNLPEEIARERSEAKIAEKKTEIPSPPSRPVSPPVREPEPSQKQQSTPRKPIRNIEKPFSAAPSAPAAPAPRPAATATDASKKSAFDEFAVESLIKLMDNMKLDIKVRIKESNQKHLFLDLIGKDRRVLVAKDGQPLNDLQYITNLMLMNSLREKKKVQLDSQGFRRRREREIIEIAKKAAEKVIFNGSDRKLSPMNPYERRLIHMTLNDNPSVTTYSLGKGFIKRVIVTPREKGRKQSADKR